MLDIFTADAWSIIEEAFRPETNRFSESIFSLGNEHMGLRGNFEERYSGDSLRGTYLAGIYYPDKTRVGWWKNGYPDFFAKVINSTNWIGIDISIDGTDFDIARLSVREFRRVLSMKTGTLTRTVVVRDSADRETRCTFSRFLSMAERHTACISVEVVPLNYEAAVTLTPYLDGNVRNEDANYREQFWLEQSGSVSADKAMLTMRTKPTPFLENDFVFAAATASLIFLNSGLLGVEAEPLRKDMYVGHRYTVSVPKGASVRLEKYVGVCTSRDFPADELELSASGILDSALEKGMDALFREHCRRMDELWAESDVVIEGDIRAQQGIRYNIFQLNQTYMGKDERLNIGPKGFSGEKYGGCTYWDTEAFCFPFYLYTNKAVAWNLLYYRYLHLDRACENAAKLHLKGALYPMVTIDGRECHNEWEITFEEIHRNGAIAYAIYNYTNYTGDTAYLVTYGIDVLLELSRFWVSRVSYSDRKKGYVILGVTGPNEYENNVNNNWYTNLMARWTLEYTCESMEYLRAEHRERYDELVSRRSMAESELESWRTIARNLYSPYDEENGVFEQNDLYMDKEHCMAESIPRSDLPLSKHWSWDRILRSCFIKQADVLQGLYFFPEKFDTGTVRRNFDFYEPRTVHESSLSPCVHSVLASRIGYPEKAYELYLRTARLDLDNYNDDTDDGIHLTSMAGSWLAIIQGFAGVAVRNGVLHLEPYVPDRWNGYSFKLEFRGVRLRITVRMEDVSIEHLSGGQCTISLSGEEHILIPCGIVNEKILFRGTAPPRHRA